MQWGLSGWQFFYQYQNTFDNNHNRLIRISQQFINGVYQNMDREVVTYNTNNQRTYVANDTWNNQLGQFEYKHQRGNKSYWHFEFPTAISNKAIESPDLKLFPNPASNSIHTVLHTGKSAGLAEFMICDNLGKIVKHWHEPTTTINKTINVADLPSGIYTLRCNNGQYYQKRFSIVR